MCMNNGIFRSICIVSFISSNMNMYKNNKVINKRKMQMSIFTFIREFHFSIQFNSLSRVYSIIWLMFLFDCHSFIHLLNAINTWMVQCLLRLKSRRYIRSFFDYVSIESLSEASYTFSFKTNVQTINTNWYSLTETQNILKGYKVHYLIPPTLAKREQY